MNQFESAPWHVIAYDNSLCLTSSINPSTNLLILPPKYFLLVTHLLSIFMATFLVQDCYQTLVCLPDIQQKPIYCHRILVKENTVFIYRAPSKENGQLMLKDPNSLLVYMQGFLKMTLRVRVTGYVIG